MQKIRYILFFLLLSIILQSYIYGSQEPVFTLTEQEKDLLNKYDSMVDVYQLSKSDIKLAITDFIFFREKVLEIYKNYSMALITYSGAYPPINSGRIKSARAAIKSVIPADMHPF